MKISLEIDSDAEEEIIIKCKRLDERTEKIQRAVNEAVKTSNLTFYKDNTEYYFPLSAVLFFETSNGLINAHTADDIYRVKEKLYQLESILPRKFIRVSKSTILNADKIYSLDKHISSFSTVTFEKSHKQVFVSRNYYKNLKIRIDERRNSYER